MAPRTLDRMLFEEQPGDVECSLTLGYKDKKRIYGGSLNLQSSQLPQVLETGWGTETTCEDTINLS